MYHVNAGKMDALKARFRDYVDRHEELDRDNQSYSRRSCAPAFNRCANSRNQHELKK